MLDSISSQRIQIQRGQKLVKTLADLGESIPVDLARASEFAQLSYTPGGRMAAAKAALEAADTEADFNKALDNYAESLVIEHQTSQVMETVRVHEQYRRLTGALSRNAGRIFETLAGKFNALAPDFTEALHVPKPSESWSAALFDWSEEEFIAFKKAQNLAEDLTDIWNPYRDLGELLGLVKRKPGKLPDGLTDWIDQVYLIGAPESVQQAKVAAEFIGAAPYTDTNRFKPVMPWYGIVVHGIKLQLSSDPADVKNQREYAGLTVGSAGAATPGISF